MAVPLPQPTNADELAWRDRIRRVLPAENRPGWQEGRSLEWIRTKTELGFAAEWVVARMVEAGELTEIVSGDRRFYRIVTGATLGVVPPAYPGLIPANIGNALIWDGTDVTPSGIFVPVISAQDLRGSRGPDGEDGENGPPGRSGERGSDGSPGTDGLNGLDGRAGVAGEDGEDGRPGRAGIDGSPGPTGATGATGATGNPGADGAVGQDGRRGWDGEDGEDGLPGRTGPAGADGAPGASGLNGTNGTNGTNGIDGRRGLDGESYDEPQRIIRVGSAASREIGTGAADLSPNSVLAASFAALTHTHYAGWRMPVAWPGTANNTTSTTVATTTTRALFFGKAHKAITSVTLIYSVTVAGVTITWAEAACATGTVVAVGSPTLTNRGYTNVAAVVNSTGIKTTSITTTGIVEGDDLWILLGNQASTVMQLRAGSIVDDLWSGMLATATARPSTMGSQLFTGGNENPIWCYALFA